MGSVVNIVVISTNCYWPTAYPISYRKYVRQNFVDLIESMNGAPQTVAPTTLAPRTFALATLAPHEHLPPIDTCSPVSFVWSYLFFVDNLKMFVVDFKMNETEKSIR